MKSLLENIAQRLTQVWRSPDTTVRRGHTYRCRCKRPIFFRNSVCLGCGATLGYEPELAEVRALQPGLEPGLWLLATEGDAAATYRRCANLDSPAGCNWLVPADNPSELCVSCRLNRTIPNLDDADNCRYWLGLRGDQPGPQAAARRVIREPDDLGRVRFRL